jgi:hypothetical protein
VAAAASPVPTGPAADADEDRPGDARTGEDRTGEAKTAPADPLNDPFSVEEIEAEFARLLGRPLDKGDGR